MKSRVTAWAAAGLVAGLSVAAGGCSSSPATTSPSPSAVAPTSSPTQSFEAEQQRQAQLTPLLVACLANHKLIPAQDLAGQSWYRNGQVADNDAFVLWWHHNNGIVVKVNGTNQIIADLVQAAASNGTWPSVCGAIPSPSASS